MDNFNPLYCFILLFSFVALYIKLKRSTQSKGLIKLPPSPPKLPLIGNLHQLSTLPHQSLTNLSNKYGPIMLLQLGQIQTLVISSMNIAREMVKMHDIGFSNRPQTTGPKLLLYDCNDFAFGPYGEYWRQARKICVLELLSLKRVQMFQHVRDEEAHVLVKSLHTASLDGLSVNLSELLMSTSNNIMSRCILGKKFDDEQGKSKYGKLTRKLFAQFTSFCFADFFPYLRWIDHARGHINQLKRTFEEFDGLVDQLIEEHKARSFSQDIQSDEKDLMDILLQLQKDGLDFELTNENIKGIILDMLLAGTDTSSNSLEWTMAELIRNPTKMKKAQEEIRGVVGKKTRIDLDELNAMEYLDCVIKESLRLHPPVPLLPRETTKSIKNVGGYDIPTKTRVFVNVYAIQRDPNLWENPINFNPERFINNPMSLSGDQENFMFLPFGGGRRGCPGSTFGVASVKSVLANLLYWFDWKLPHENLIAEELNIDESPGLGVTKKVPLQLKPISHFP